MWRRSRKTSIYLCASFALVSAVFPAMVKMKARLLDITNSNIKVYFIEKPDFIVGFNNPN